MGGEIQNFFKVWILAIASLCYCYYVAARFPKGIPRLISLLPILYLLTVLPFDLHSFHLGGPTVFFLLWLANSNLLLFSFDQGSLSPPPPKLLHFISLACLPIKLRNTNKEQIKNSHDSVQELPKKVLRSVLFAIKMVLLVLLFHTYSYKQFLHPYVSMVLYCCHVYLEAELLMVLCGAPARAFLGFELQPQFNEPYLASSLQDFWGRRWNLVVSGTLRQTVYDPVRGVSTPVFGEWAKSLAMLAAFFVSALVHEVIYYHLTRVRPTWEVTWFFVLHGFCTAVEVVVKRMVRGRWRLHRAVSGMLTVGLVVVTGVWLFLPQLTRNGVDEKAIGEYLMLEDFVKRNLLRLYHLSFR